MSNSLWTHWLYNPWNSPGQNTGVSSLSLHQRIFPTKGSNQGLLLCRQILYQLSHKGSPRIQEWVACPFASRSSWPGNWTGVSCIAGRFFTNLAMRENLWFLFYWNKFLLYQLCWEFFFFYHKWMFNFAKCFTISIEMITFFISCILLIYYIILIYLYILNHLYIPGRNPT